MLRQLDSHRQKNEVGPPPLHHIKKLTQNRPVSGGGQTNDVNVITKNIKLLEEKIVINHCQIRQ